MVKSSGDSSETKPGQEISTSSEKLTVSDAERIETQANTNAASRAIAVIILMLVPGIAGSYLDKWLNTQFFVVIGFALGIGIAIFGLLYVSRIADIAAQKSREMRKRIASDSEKTTIEKDVHE